MAIQPTQPQSIGGVLDTTFQLYKAALMPSIPLTLLLVIAGSPSSIYVMTHSSAGAADPLAMLALVQNPNYWLAALASMVGFMWLLAALYLKIGALGAGEDVSVGTALQKAIGRLPTLLLMMIVFMIVITIGFLLLLVPGLILTVTLALCFAPAVFEGKGPIDSLLESHRLVWGNWWRTAAILTVGFIVVMVIYMVAVLLIGAVTPLAAGSGENLTLVSSVAGMAIGALMSMLITPFYVGLAIATYWDLKLRKEGGDLAARVGALKPA
jgi:Uncharacterised protein family (UPF0259)